MIIKNNKGSITIFVLVGLLFMTSFLVVLYANNLNKSKTSKEQFDILSKIYSPNESDEKSYNEAYTGLREKKLQDIEYDSQMLGLENVSQIELVKTVEEKVNNYRIYGASVKNNISEYTVSPTQKGFIPYKPNSSYPITSSKYPNATYEIIRIYKGQTLTFNYTGTRPDIVRIRCIDADTDLVVCDLVNKDQEITETEYYSATIYYSFQSTDNGDLIDGYVTAKKDFKLGIMNIKNDDEGNEVTEDFELIIGGSEVLGVGDNSTNNLPEEYQELEYIESTGIQYIDTGFAPNQDTSLEFEFMQLEDDDQFHPICGGRYANIINNTSSYAIWFSGEDEKIRFDYGEQATLSSRATEINKKYKITTNKNELNFNDKENINSSYSSFQSPNSMYIFNINQSTNSNKKPNKMRLYYFKIYDNANLIRDFIPCYNKESRSIGLYDMVNNVFYENVEEGNFIAGPKISRISIKSTDVNNKSFINTISLNESLKADDYIDFNLGKVIRSGGTEEKVSLPDISTFEDYTKIDILTSIKPLRIELKYKGYTFE